MKHFWQGFSKYGSSPVGFKKHVIVLYWSPDESGGDSLKQGVSKLSVRYPSVKVKVINIKKDPLKPMKHDVKRFPTVLLLKEGREVDRLEDKAGNMTLLEQLFRKAHV